MGTEEITRRLRRVEGQVRGLQRMVEEERDCEAILTQLIAARSALDRVGVLVVDRFVAACLTSPDRALAQQQVGRVLDLIFSRYSASGTEEDQNRESPSMEEEQENGQTDSSD